MNDPQAAAPRSREELAARLDAVRENIGRVFLGKPDVVRQVLVALLAEGHVLLDDVPGLGEARSRAVRKHFGSLKRLRAATVEELAEVTGIGPRTAAAIAEVVASSGNGKTVAVNTATGEIQEG